MVEWLNQSGGKKKRRRKSNVGVEASSLYHDPEKRDFFSEETRKLGLDPAKTTTFNAFHVVDLRS
jgi:hypothetical protein